MSTALIAHAQRFAAALLTAGLFAEALGVQGAAILGGPRLIAVELAPYIEPAVDDGWSSELNDALCDLYRHAHSTLRAQSPGDPLVIADAADEWEAAHPVDVLDAGVDAPDDGDDRNDCDRSGAYS